MQFTLRNKTKDYSLFPTYKLQPALRRTYHVHAVYNDVYLALWIVKYDQNQRLTIT